MKSSNLLLLIFVCGSLFLFVTLYLLLHRTSIVLDAPSSEKETSPAEIVRVEVPKPAPVVPISHRNSKLPPPNLFGSTPNKPVRFGKNPYLGDTEKIEDSAMKKVEQPKPKAVNVLSAKSVPKTCPVLNTCDKDLDDKLNKPVLSDADYQWCIDQLNPAIGGVIVGKSWGRLKTLQERTKFENLNCNAVNSGINPSCNHAWGDLHIFNWRKKIVVNQTCSFPSSSVHPSVQCYGNDINDLYCVFSYAQIDFSKFKKVSNPGSSIPKREFRKDFMTLPCSNNVKIPDFKFDHLFSTAKQSSFSVESDCDEVIPGTTLLYSHDNIRNLALTMNDFMNVWLLLWLEGIAKDVNEINFLTIDSMKQYNDFDDLVNSFFVLYQKSFKRILRSMDFRQKASKKKICFERLITQSLPSRGFVWDHWHEDLPCSFQGPSSLFQRWNLQIRQNLGLLPRSSLPATAIAQGYSPSASSTSLTAEDLTQCPSSGSAGQRRHRLEKIVVLLIVRSESQNEWGSYRTSRLLSNVKEVQFSLSKLIEERSASPVPLEFRVQDFKNLPSYDEQIKLMSQVSILIGMHGAGIVQSMLMSLGAENCCGVIEIIPEGEFSPVRGFGNMIRKMGFQYHRMALDKAHSRAEGATVPIESLKSQLSAMIGKVTGPSSCVLSSVVRDPFLQR